MTSKALKKKLQEIVARLGTRYGQDSFTDGEVFEVKSGTVQAAVAEVHGAEYTKTANLLEHFNALGQNDGEESEIHDEFMAVVKDWGFEYDNVLFAAVGNEDDFTPGKPDNGAFYFAFLFLFQACPTKCVLVTFKCTES